MSAKKSNSILPKSRDNDGNLLYDSVIIHPKLGERVRMVLEGRAKGLFVFPISALSSIKEFLSGRDYKGKPVPQGTRRALNYFVEKSARFTSNPDRCSQRVPASRLIETIKQYHPNAVIEDYQPSSVNR
ncbi:MAG: hypothetical protein AABW80_05120 [Nanoarchaeota archaeon]